LHIGDVPNIALVAFSRYLASSSIYFSGHSRAHALPILLVASSKATRRMNFRTAKIAVFKILSGQKSTR